MKKYKYIMFITFIFLLSIVGWVYADNIIPQTSTLSGVVSSKCLVQQGDVVKEGQVLLSVDSIAGNVPASRATVDGTVSEVLVKPGDNIKNGQVVVKIKSAK